LPTSDSALVLVSNKAALVKVNVTTTDTRAAKPAGSLRVETASGQLVQEIALTAPTGALPTAVPAVPSFSDSYTAVIPANLVTSGMRLTATVPTGQNASTVVPRVGGGVAVRLVAVPVQLGSTVGQVVANAHTNLQARIPAASVTLQTRATYVSTSVTSLPTTESAWDTAFGKVLAELDDLHMLEGANNQTYYYGFVPKRTYGLAGLGYMPGNAALGFDMPSDATAVRETLVHEFGHNLSLAHAPCGSAEGEDPQYPYADGRLGASGRYVWGYNAVTSRFIDPRNSDLHDIMSYCGGESFSDYNYRKMQVYLTPADRSVTTATESPSAAAAGPQELLLVSGLIESGKLVLSPVKSLHGQPRLPRAGSYVLRVVTAQGTVEYPFQAKQIDHAVSLQRFGFTIPHPGAIVSITIVKDGVTLLQNEAKAASASAQTEHAASVRPQVEVSEQGGVLRLTWDQAKYPYLTVTHVGAQRSTLAQDLRNGSASLPSVDVPAGGSFEFSLSDGLNTVRATRAR
jgi:hypothetical protein